MTDTYAYDVFKVRGKIAKPGDGAAEATINAMTLGPSEIIVIPLTIASTISESTEKHTLVIFYDKELKYRIHSLYDKAGQEESISGY